MVGIEAESREAAIARANELFEQGDIWDDTTEVPLFYDDFKETGDAGIALEFTIEDEISGDWPEPEASVKKIRRRDAAFQVARLLVEAYCRGEDIEYGYLCSLLETQSGLFYSSRGGGRQLEINRLIEKSIFSSLYSTIPHVLRRRSLQTRPLC